MRARVPYLTPVQAAILVLDGLGIGQPRRRVLLGLSIAAERTHHLRAIRKVDARVRGAESRVQKPYRILGTATRHPIARRAFPCITGDTVRLVPLGGG